MKFLRDKGKNVFLTCYTGISCTKYGGLNATTLHKFAGLGDGRYSDDELLHLIKTHERSIKTKNNISTADVLIFLFIKGCFLPSLVEIGPVVLEKIF